MALSVRMDPLLEKELELTAQRLGMSKSQFIIQAVERELGRKDPLKMLHALQLQEQEAHYMAQDERPYGTASARKQIKARLSQKHHVRSAD